ncbi:MAG TPA: hypothetical protein VKQ11_00675 [Candidatus Sulfotelmatobacter sp.]|nr:hypothetical protein [Candidatus Sulfotelmatobacter sp.]
MTDAWTEAEIALRNARVFGTAQQSAKPVILHAKDQRAKGRVRVSKGMNKTEARYEAHLAMRKRLGEVLFYRFEFVTVKIAEDTRYTADFTVMLADGSMELHDCKIIRSGQDRAHIEDDSLVKMCVAAESPFVVKAVWPLPSGEWGEREF